MKKISIIYWVITGLVALGFLMSAIMYLSRNEEILKGFQFLSVPLALVPFLGVAKAAGAIGIVQNWFPLLKEWAYAGLVINLLGAVYLHLATNTPFMAPLVFLVLVAISYFLYHKKEALAKSISINKRQPQVA